MSVMQSEVFEAFRDIGASEEKALKAATALSKRDDDVASIKTDIITIKAELGLLKWMVGFCLTFNLAILVKLFVH